MFAERYNSEARSKFVQVIFKLCDVDGGGRLG